MKPVDFEDMRVTIERSLRNLDAWLDASASHDALVTLNRELEIAWRIRTRCCPGLFRLMARTICLALWSRPARCRETSVT